MGIAEIQKKRILDEITRAYFSTGEKPTLTHILKDGSDYFNKFPIGKPLPIETDGLIPKLRSDVDKFNEMFARLALNIDVLYEACNDQVEAVMTLTTILRTELERLRSRRQRLITVIDDKLFTLYNTDGYYYSISDTFNTLDLVDLTLTSAFVDTQSSAVQLPTLSSLTKRVDMTQVSAVSIVATVNGQEQSFKILGSFDGALDGLTNTLWGIEITTDTPSEVVVNLALQLNSNDSTTISLSRVDFDPYGMQPVQMFIETENRQLSTVGSASSRLDFSDHIQTSSYNMSFIDATRVVDAVYITLRKTQHDFTEQVNGAIKYHYIFGAKNIIMTEQVYDSSAVLVSTPLFLDADLINDNVIDAVSLVTEEHIAQGTDIAFFVAPDIANEQPSLGDFDWKQITPLGSIDDNPNVVVHFNGAQAYAKKIISTPSTNDLQLIAFDNNNADLTKRNPSAAIISGATVYRIASFGDQDILPASIKLEEGVNSTRIYYTSLNDNGLNLEYWKDYINGNKTTNTVYGAIDTGNEFFYGGDVGEAHKSVYIETYLESLTDQPLLLKEIIKTDINSQLWDIKLYLNGREIGNLPVGTNKLLIPWKFQEGINHIILLAQIPAVSIAYPNPYVGSLDLMGDDDLFSFGTVKLATWNYVDIFKMQYNEVNQPYTFTIYNNEIISRRQPTTNFRIKYSKSTKLGPSAVRLRADFSRSQNDPSVTPVLKSFRLRFLYAQ